MHATDTVYGIAGDPDAAEVVRRINRLKGRAATPLSVAVASVEEVARLARVGRRERRVLAEHLPGLKETLGSKEAKP